MPLKDIDYSKTIIYKLVHKNDINNKNIYIGHTTNFRGRKATHKKSCNNLKDRSYHLKQYVFISENGGWDNWLMIEIQKYPCLEGNEARALEQYWLNFYKANLNSNIPNITKKEYREDNKKLVSEKSKIYRENIKKLLSEKSKNYRENNKEIISEKKIYI